MMDSSESLATAAWVQFITNTAANSMLCVNVLEAAIFLFPNWRKMRMALDGHVGLAVSKIIIKRLGNHIINSRTRFTKNYNHHRFIFKSPN